ncbi:MAG: tetratricopeptide repeat protein [Alphaproteobacteria bacterium]|nr:tetratricopeptide repeat protein [Alphaproteobacteria bacterium]
MKKNISYLFGVLLLLNPNDATATLPEILEQDRSLKPYLRRFLSTTSLQMDTKLFKKMESARAYKLLDFEKMTEELFKEKAWIPQASKIKNATLQELFQPYSQEPSALDVQMIFLANMLYEIGRMQGNDTENFTHVKRAATMGHAGAQYKMFLVAYQQGQEEEAKDYLFCSAAQSNLGALITLSKIYQGFWEIDIQRNLDMAQLLCEEANYAFELSPNDNIALFRHAVELYILDRYNEAFEKFICCLKIDRSNSILFPHHVYTINEINQPRIIDKIESLYSDSFHKIINAILAIDREYMQIINANNLCHEADKLERFGSGHIGLLQKNSSKIPDQCLAFIANRAQIYKEDWIKFKGSLEYQPNIANLTQIIDLLIKFGRLDEALPYCNRFVELWPNHAEALKLRGIVLDKLDCSKQALAHYNDSLKLRPNDVPTLMSRGNLFKHLGCLNEALDDYTQALELDPNNPALLNNRGQIFYNLGYYQKAVVDFKHSITFHHPDSQTLTNLGIALYHLGFYEEALLELNHSLVHRPNHNFTLVNRGNTLAQLERYAEALEDYNHSRKEQQNNPTFLSNRGWVLDNLGHYDEALVDYTYSLNLRPNHAITLNNRSRTLNNLGRYLDALVDCDYCLELEPNFEAAKANKKSILHTIIHNKKHEINFNIFNFSFARTVFLFPYNLITRFLGFGLQFLPNRLWRQHEPEVSTPPNTLKDALVRQKKKLDQEYKRASRLEESLDEQKEYSTALESDLAKATQQVSALNKNLEKQQNQSQIKSERIRQLEGDLKKYKRKVDGSTELTSKQNRLIYELNEKVEDLQQQIVILQSNLEQDSTLKKQYELQKQTLEGSSRHIAQLDEELKKENFKIVTLEKQIRIAKKKMSTQQVELEKSDILRKKLDEETKLVKEASLQVTDLERNLKETLEKVASLSSKIEQQFQLTSLQEQENERLRHQLQEVLKQVTENGSLKELCDTQMQKIHFLRAELTRNYQQTLIVQPAIVMEATPVIQLPYNVRHVLQHFIRENHHVLIVGGAVRDYILKRIPADIDIITSMPPYIFIEELKEYCIHTNPYVSGLYQMSIEGLKIDISYSDTEVFYSEAAFLKDAISRVFTVNALYCDLNGKIYDPTQRGIADLLYYPTLRLISVESNWFEKDPYLMLRATRLAVQNELIIPLEIKRLMRQSAVSLNQCDPQRLFVEFKRLFLRGFAAKNFEQLMELDLLRFVFPKTVEYLLSSYGVNYLEWLRSELHLTDQLIMRQEPASINYIYAMFLTGSVLSALNQSSVPLSDIDQVIDKVVSEMFQDYSRTDFLEKIRKLTSRFVRKMLLPETHSDLPNLSR